MSAIALLHLQPNVTRAQVETGLIAPFNKAHHPVIISEQPVGQGKSWELNMPGADSADTVNEAKQMLAAAVPDWAKMVRVTGNEGDLLEPVVQT